jgi:hypothetical protein
MSNNCRSYPVVLVVRQRELLMMATHELIDGKRWTIVLDEGEQLYPKVPRATLPFGDARMQR